MDLEATGRSLHEAPAEENLPADDILRPGRSVRDFELQALADPESVAAALLCGDTLGRDMPSECIASFLRRRDGEVHRLDLNRLAGHPPIVDTPVSEGNS